MPWQPLPGMPSPQHRLAIANTTRRFSGASFSGKDKIKKPPIVAVFLF